MHPPDDGRSSSAVVGTELGLRRPTLQPEGLLLFRGRAKLLRVYSPPCFPLIAASAVSPS